ncbi:MAG: Carotenogenesis protein CarS [Acidobacteriales bacterium]|nr:Carotenogenesis protein CarS [Terriglobales bacterium]
MSIGQAKPLRRDVPGAPFRIGQQVRVVAGTDETFDKRFLGKLGTVEYFEYNCGCGQSYPHDPMIGVRFGRKLEEFWVEELASHGPSYD